MPVSPCSAHPVARLTIGRAWQRQLAMLLRAGLLWIACSGVAHAGAIDALEQFLAGTQRADGRFVQDTLATGGQTVERASGRFAFERPGRFRWMVDKPFEQVMVADGTRLWFFDRDLNQVTVRPVAQAMGATPAAILFGSAGLGDDFVLSESGDKQGLQWLDAAPRNKEAGFEKIRIGFADGLPGAMEVVDAFGRTIRFTFSALRSNPDLDVNAFRFDLPPGADVVSQ